MLVLETKLKQSSIRLWMDGEKLNKYDLSAYCAVLAKNFEWAKKLNSQARQVSSERAWSAISRFFDNCKKKVSGKTCAERSRSKGFPKFKKRGQSVEYWIEITMLR
jgi:putative transposase